MHVSPFARAATAVLLAVGMSAVGATAAFADDITPPTDSTIASESSEPTEPTEPAEPAEPEMTTETTEPTTADPADPVDPEQGEPEPVLTEADTVPDAVPATVTDPTPYKLLAWQLPCGVADPFCAPGQTLGHALDLAAPSLGALDGLIIGTCSDWQVDLEWDSATTTALIGIGVLTAPGAPAEDHAYGSLGAGVNPWKYIDNADCVIEEEVDPIVVVVPPVVVTPPAVQGGQALVAPVVSSTRYTCPAAGCAQQTGQLPTLALTGSDSIWMLWAALAMLAAGLVVVQLQAHSSRRAG